MLKGIAIDTVPLEIRRSYDYFKKGTLKLVNVCSVDVDRILNVSPNLCGS